MTTNEEHDARAAAKRLLDWFAPYQRAVVAFSAGVDSSVVAAAAQRALGDQARAVTASGPALARGELEEARRVAAQIGIQHQVLEAGEIHQAEYVRNDARRCYHCKSALYERLSAIASRATDEVIVSGTNADDFGDYRPGLEAAAERNILHPLAECGLGKDAVRAIARVWELPVWDKPATPCLASRIAYGVPVTAERLARIDAAEQTLRTLGIRECRVRLHDGELARVEVPPEAISRLAEPAVREPLVARLTQLGFRKVTLDLAGFTSGGMNVFLPIELVAHPT